MPGIPDAELPDQSWMKPATSEKRPVAPYSEFNPPPLSSDPRSTGDESAVYLRKIYRFLMGAAIGGLVGVAIYFLIVYF